MNMNSMPDVAPPDAVSSMILFKFPFKFVGEDAIANDPQPYFRLKDETIKSFFCKRPDVINAWTWLVIDAYKPRAVVPCDSVLANTTEFREDKGDNEGKVIKAFKVTGDRSDVITLASLKDLASSLGLDYEFLRDQLIRDQPSLQP